MPPHPQTKARPEKSGTSPHKPFTPAELAAIALNEKKAEGIVTISLKGKSSIADHLVIASGTSAKHVTSLAEAVADTLNASKIPVIGIEGLNEGFWVVVDAGDVIIHIFQPEARELYQLEKMWSIPFNTENDDDLDHTAA
ncbi:MAG: ribosome silencing factor [Alphaproteobacteria bacterium]|nr:ribosome silencing factor [Alphaproteobacteria bacterium]MDD9919410.1 ribosome silencing factor [Alphaproteobacteria bacterium]